MKLGIKNDQFGFKRTSLKDNNINFYFFKHIYYKNIIVLFYLIHFKFHNCNYQCRSCYVLEFDDQKRKLNAIKI